MIIRNCTVALGLMLAASFASAQMQPGMGGQQPGMGGQQPGMGQHIPGVGEPGMGGTSGIPGSDPQRTQTSQTSTPKVDDDTLLRQVHEQLARENEFSDVRTSVNNGVVTLEGSVPQKEDRKKARQLVGSIPGVRKVKEKLSIRTGGPSASTLPENVGGVTSGGSKPEVSQNTAGSISGNASAESGTAAGTASMSQSGSSTGSAPSTNPGTTPASNAGANPASPPANTVGTPPSDNATLQGEIQNALQRNSMLKDDSVAVNVTDDSIDLTGTVSNGKDKQAAKAIAESYAGNRKVEDHLTVVPNKQ